MKSPARWPARRGSLPCRSVARLGNVFAPRDRIYFELFEEAGQNVLKASDLLDQLLATYPDSKGLEEDIVVCEHEGDRITHDIIDRLDFTEEVAVYLGLYKIEAPMDQSIKLARILKAACRQISDAIPRLRGFSDISHYTVEINRLENEGDRITREAMASLFDGGIDPMVVIRWKDLFERLEEAIDATERVANILEGIVIKNS